MLLLVLLGTGSLLSAGQPVSTHYEQHRLFYSAEATSEADYDAIMGFPSFERKRRTNKHFMRRTVYGFHPGWCGTTWRSYDYGLLPVVAYYGYIVNPSNGSPKTSYFWKTSGMIDEAHAKGSAVDLVVATGSKKDNRRLLSNDVAVNNLVDSLSHYLKLRDGDGICIDFEKLGGKQTEGFSAFVKRLHAKLAIDHPKATLTLCLPAEINPAYEIDSLQPFIDFYIVKPYTQERLPDDPFFPPLSSKDAKQPSVNSSISTWLKAGVSKEKLLLGTPNFSLMLNAGFPSTSMKVRWPELVTYSDLKRNYNYPHHTDSITGRELYQWVDEINFYSLYASDENSMRQRFELASDRNLSGVAIWALGYDHGFDALWNQLKASFSQSVKDEVQGLAIEEQNGLLLGPDNGETRERNRNNWIPMLVGCLIFTVLLLVLRRFMKAGPGM